MLYNVMNHWTLNNNYNHWSLRTPSKQQKFNDNSSKHNKSPQFLNVLQDQRRQGQIKGEKKEMLGSLGTSKQNQFLNMNANYLKSMAWWDLQVCPNHPTIEW